MKSGARRRCTSEQGIGAIYDGAGSAHGRLMFQRGQEPQAEAVKATITQHPILAAHRSSGSGT